MADLKVVWRTSTVVSIASNCENHIVESMLYIFNTYSGDNWKTKTECYKSTYSTKHRYVILWLIFYVWSIFLLNLPTIFKTTITNIQYLIFNRYLTMTNDKTLTIHYISGRLHMFSHHLEKLNPAWHNIKHKYTCNIIIYFCTESTKWISTLSVK